MYYYLLDKLNQENAEVLKKALKTANSITGVETRVRQGLLEVLSSRNPEKELKMACDIAGVVLRREVKKKDL